ncbi:MAG TPA: hypothetical protein VG122_04955 [Gemmata sp.]|jgi:hypothetical protein|nr:hypothetical protein [Gemmata sp.]
MDSYGTARISEETDGPAHPDRLSVDWHEQPDSLVLIKPNERPGGCVLLFLVVWLIGSAFGCGALLFKLVKEPSLEIILFAVMLCSAWLGVVALLIWSMFGKEMLFLDRNEAIFVRKIVVRFSSRVIPLQEVQGFREYTFVTHRRGREVRDSSIEMVTDGKPLQFAHGLEDDERAWLIHRLNCFLTSNHNRPLGLRTAIPSSTHSSGTAAANDWDECAEVLVALSGTLPTPPSDCSWRLTEGSDGFEVKQKGRLKIGTLATALLFNGALNGLVSLFLLALFGGTLNKIPLWGGKWWMVFAILIPFEAAGLFMFIALILVCIEPFRYVSWRFECDRIIRRKCRGLLGLTRTWYVVGPIRLELRGEGDEPQDRSPLTILLDRSPCRLVIVSEDNVDICVIENLTEGEARWLAHLIHKRCPQWADRV